MLRGSGREFVDERPRLDVYAHNTDASFSPGRAPFFKSVKRSEPGNLGNRVTFKRKGIRYEILEPSHTSMWYPVV